MKIKIGRIFTYVALAGGAIPFIIGAALIFSLPTMWLWDWLMPTIFGLKTITLWQALGLQLLCGILFKPSKSSSSSSSSSSSNSFSRR